MLLTNCLRLLVLPARSRLALRFLGAAAGFVLLGCALAGCYDDPPNPSPAGWGEPCGGPGAEPACQEGLACWGGGNGAGFYCTNACEVKSDLSDTCPDPIEPGFPYTCLGEEDGCVILCVDGRCPATFGDVPLECLGVFCKTPR